MMNAQSLPKQNVSRTQGIVLPHLYISFTLSSLGCAVIQTFSVHWFPNFINSNNGDSYREECYNPHFCIADAIKCVYLIATYISLLQDRKQNPYALNE